ncbi:SGNH/GDSL hydrolase family protein [Cohnella sp. NL03-T5]|nr:SGNH/GDSL hydrolase family protein [Cohnella silvisoli]
MRLAETDSSGLEWFSPIRGPFRIFGFAWLQKDEIYRRLPVNPGWNVPEDVDQLANCTAGGQIRFMTDSSKLSIRVRLSGLADMYHLPATGQCGFDCYIGEPGEQQYYSTTRYDHTQKEYENELFDDGGERKIRCFTLNFPLYQGVEEVYIGLEPRCHISAPPAYDNEKKVIFYGTSITQGGCASRPGMAYTNILSRRINLEFINLGFSGNGKGEPELARIIAEIANPACLVLDYEANCVDTESLRASLPEFIRIYREKHPKVPILILSKIKFAKEEFSETSAQVLEERKEIQRFNVEKAKNQGDDNIHFFDGSSLPGEYAQECTVDGVHPTDLGFLMMANGLTPVIQRLVSQ